MSADSPPVPLPTLLRVGTCLTKPMDVHAAFKRAAMTDEALENMQLLTRRREGVVAVMKTVANDLDGVAPRQIMAALREYLPYVGTVCTQLLAAGRVRETASLRFMWTSKLGPQPPRKTREVVMVTCTTFQEECAFCFAAYAVAHLQAAEELLRRSAEGGGVVARADDLIGAALDGAEDPPKEAAALLRAGAGILLWMVQVLLPRLGLAGAPGVRAAEMNPHILSSLYHTALGDVQEIAVAKALRGGKAGPGLAGKLHLGASEKYALAWAVLRKGGALELANAEVKDYMALKHSMHKALGLMWVARQCEADEKWGRAVAVLRLAAAAAGKARLGKGTAENPGLRTLEQRCRAVEAEVGAELRRVHNDNERVYYQPEPPAVSDLPKGTLLQAAREEAFEPPASLDAYFFATDPDKKGACRVM